VVWEERIDDVLTVRSGQPTGQMPPATTREFFEPCEIRATRAWWEKERFYKCASEDDDWDLDDIKRRLDTVYDSTELNGNTLSYDDLQITDNAETVIQDMTSELYMDFPDGGACVPTCLVQETESETSMISIVEQNVTETPNDYREPAGPMKVQLRCTNDACPVKEGQVVVRARGCDNSDFTEAMVYMEVLNHAGKDITCSTVPPEGAPAP